MQRVSDRKAAFALKTGLCLVRPTLPYVNEDNFILLQILQRLLLARLITLDVLHCLLESNFVTSLTLIKCLIKGNFSLPSKNRMAFHNTTTGFPTKWYLRNCWINSILLTCHYPELSSASDCSCNMGNLLLSIRSNIQIREVTCHHTSLSRETSGRVAKCWVFSQASFHHIEVTGCNTQTIYLTITPFNGSWNPSNFHMGVLMWPFLHINIFTRKFFKIHIISRYFVILHYYMSKKFIYLWIISISKINYF